MKREYVSLVYNDTWGIIPLPTNKTIVSGKWSYQAKTDAGGTIQGHKARYVVVHTMAKDQFHKNNLAYCGSDIPPSIVGHSH